MKKVLTEVCENILDNINEPINDDTLLRYIIKKGIVLDELTNGEFMERFLKAKRIHELHTDVSIIIVRIGNSFMSFDLSWWNSKWEA